MPGTNESINSGVRLKMAIWMVLIMQEKMDGERDITHATRQAHHLGFQLSAYPLSRSPLC